MTEGKNVSFPEGQSCYSDELISDHCLGMLCGFQIQSKNNDNNFVILKYQLYISYFE